MKFIKRYRGWFVMLLGMIFNLIESLLVYRPEGVIFNLEPLTVMEWILDIVAFAIVAFGFILTAYDINTDSKLKIKEGIIEAVDESNCEVELKNK